LAINNWLEDVVLPPNNVSPTLPEAGEVLEGLWLDTDPNVALWANIILQQLYPERSNRLLQTPRTGLPVDATLTAFIQDKQPPSLEIISLLAQLPLIQRFEPATLLHLDRLCSLRHWRVGDPIETTPRGVLIVLAGQCDHRQSLEPDSPPTSIASHGKGSILGLANYFGESNSVQQPDLVAAEHGCSALAFSRTGFRELLDVSPVFEQSLLRDLAINCEFLQRSLQAV
jgi:CRP-like cAMP-binding protein